MLLLAQVPPPPAAVASWLEVLFYLAGGVTMVVVCWHHLSGRGDTKRTPQPFEVKEHPVFATKAELDDVKRQVSELAEKIEDGFASLDTKRSHSLEKLHTDLQQRTESLRLEIKADTEGLHNRITDVLSAFSELRGEVNRDHKS